MNKLHDVLINCQAEGLLTLPRIVVVGSQSAGKSSVLESIVGKDFLPRGTGIVTRRPLILKCIRNAGPEYAEFGHLPGVKFDSFDNVREEIEQVTKDLVGENKAISAIPISLEVYSSKVVDITLVDLPGIVVNPVGDQPQDIEIQVRTMILSYIQHPNSLILAISPANVDIATSEAIKIAREVDPKGERTLGVITKLDCLGAGEDALDVLEGRTLPLRLGYVGIICRSQADIMKNVRVEQHLVKENEYFANHQSYRHIKERLGTPYLSQRLNTLLINHICEKVPKLKRQISELLSAKEEELKRYGEPIVGREAQKMLLLTFLQKFTQVFCDSIEGRSVKKITDELRGGARIGYIFNDLYRKAMNNIDPFQDLSDQDIRTAMLNAAGPRGNLFVPELAFELLVKNQIEKLKIPSLNCIQMVFEELKALVSSLEMDELDRFENLREAIGEVVNRVLTDSLGPAQDMVRSLIEIELCYINTQHPDFIPASSALQTAQAEFDIIIAMQRQESPPPAKPVVSPPKASESSDGVLGWIFGRRNQPSSSAFEDLSDSRAPRSSIPSVPSSIRASDDPSNREMVETIVIKKLIESYFLIVRKNIGDSVPKTIMHFLVNKSKESLGRTLVAQLYKEDRIEQLLHESGSLHTKRMKCLEAVEQLRTANEVLSEVRDMRERV